MTPEGGAIYRVLYDKVASELREIRDRAVAGGTARELLQTFILLHSSLQVDPLNFGDPIRVKGDVHVLHRLLQPLNITYSVHVSLRLVYLQRISLYPAE